MRSSEGLPGEDSTQKVSWGDVPEIKGIDAGSLRTVLTSNILSLLRLSPPLERAFRSYYREHAARILRYSVYGLMAIYLMVIIPVLTLLPAEVHKTFWLRFAVFPIGVVLVGLWLSTRAKALQQYVEQTLSVALYICLSGTIYCALIEGDAIYGHVAAYETIFIIIIAFSLLRLSAQIALTSTLLAFGTAAIPAQFVEMQSSWLNVLLFFFVPLLICAINGLMLEYAARRDFVQTLFHQQEKATVLRDIAAVGNEIDDIHVVLESTIKLLCSHRGWLAGQASLMDPDTGGMRPVVLHISPTAGSGWFRGFDRLVQTVSDISMAPRVLASGELAWSSRMLQLPGLTTPEGIINARLAAPIKVGAEVVAVLEFFAGSAEQPDERLRMLMEQVGHQLGHVFARKRRHQELLDRATHDTLTGLPNRAHLLERIAGALARAQRRGSSQFCVCFMDVDRFKWINDSLGHDVGDQLLIEVGQRIRRGMRPTDVVARLGGDEFVLLIEDVDSVSGAISAAQRIQEELRRPIVIHGHPIHYSGSLGIVMGSLGYARPEEILRDADVAMYHAKQRGRGGYVVFSETMSRQNVDRLRLVNELREAISEGELVLHYQPIVSLADGMVTGFEALIRWQHPQRGLLGPGLFIPVAEESSLIIPLTRWVVNETCRQIASWHRQFPGLPKVTVSANMCAAYFAQEGMPDEIMEFIQRHEIKPECLRLEITETQVMDNIDACMNNIRRLREQGVYVYVDDFGTGYSSLNYLASFNASTLKIDQSFVAKLSDQDRDGVIIRAITLLGQHLGMEVIAEGIETVDQLNSLREMGCDYGQGYYFSRPLPVIEAGAMIGKSLVEMPPLAVVRA